MAKIMFDGTQGILSGEWDGEAISRRAEEARKREAELDAGLAKAQATCDAIDTMLDQSLKGELAAEMQCVRLTKQQKKDFADFKEYSEGQLDLRALPAAPQAVALYLIKRMPEGARVVERIRNSISAAHRTLGGFEDPANDIATRALMRRVRAADKDDPTPQEKERV
jgi:hypothetical protein